MSAVTDPDLIARLNANRVNPGSDLEKRLNQNAQRGARSQQSAPSEEAPSNPLSAMFGAYRGALDTMRGIPEAALQLSSALSGDDEELKRLQYYKGREDEAFRNLGADSAAGQVGRLVGNVATLPVPASRAPSIGGRLAESAGIGALQGASAPADTLGERASNAGAGALIGPAFELGAAGIGYGVNKVNNARKGNLALDQEQRGVLDFAEANDLPVAADDLSKSATARWTGTQIDQVPLIGGGAFRKNQGEAAKRAADDFIAEFTPGGEVTQEITESSQRVLEGVKAKKRQLYTEAFDKLDAAGPQTMNNLRISLSKLLQEEKARGSQASPVVVKELEDLINAPNGPMSYWHSVRSELGDKTRRMMTGNKAIITDRAGGQLERAKAMIDDAFSEQANAIGGEAADMWRRADGYYKENVVPYKRGLLGRALKDVESPEGQEAVLNILTGTGTTLGRDSKAVAKTLYDALDDEGRNAVAYAMLTKAMNKATTDGKPFHPAIFARSLEAMEGRLGVFLKGEQKAYAEGLQKYMRYIESAGHYAHNPPTGRQLLGPLLGIGAVMEPALVTKIATGVVGSKALLRTKRGRSLLLAMSSTPPESQRAAEIAREINSLLARSATANQAQP